MRKHDKSKANIVEPTVAEKKIVNHILHKVSPQPVEHVGWWHPFGHGRNEETERIR